MGNQVQKYLLDNDPDDESTHFGEMGQHSHWNDLTHKELASVVVLLLEAFDVRLVRNENGLTFTRTNE